jgi:hypothetical protein
MSNTCKNNTYDYSEDYKQKIIDLCKPIINLGISLRDGHEYINRNSKLPDILWDVFSPNGILYVNKLTDYIFNGRYKGVIVFYRDEPIRFYLEEKTINMLVKKTY